MSLPTIPPKAWARFHAGMVCFWLLMILPTVLWWKNSILWVSIMSVWALVAGHFSSWQGARAEKKVDDGNGNGDEG